jgi:hypothetical protein
MNDAPGATHRRADRGSRADRQPARRRVLSNCEMSPVTGTVLQVLRCLNRRSWRSHREALACLTTYGLVHVLSTSETRLGSRYGWSGCDSRGGDAGVAALTRRIGGSRWTRPTTRRILGSTPSKETSPGLGRSRWHAPRHTRFEEAALKRQGASRRAAAPGQWYGPAHCAPARRRIRPMHRQT